MTVIVRPRRTGDLPGLVAVLAEVHESDHYPILGTHVERGWLTLPSGPAWVAEVNGVLAGQVALDRGLDAAHAEALDVEPSAGAMLSRYFVSLAARGAGAGAALLDAAEQWARDERCPLGLDVVSHNRAARTVYVRRGWREIGSYEADWFGAQGPTVQAHRFVLALPSHECETIGE